MAQHTIRAIWTIGKGLEDYLYKRQSDGFTLAHVYPKVVGGESFHGYICECRDAHGRWLDQPISEGLALIPATKSGEAFVRSQEQVRRN